MDCLQRCCVNVTPLLAMMETHRVRLGIVVFCLLFAASSFADSLRVKVAEPFVDIHTGPGMGYPIFHVVEQDAPLTLLFRRGGWIKVQTARQREGWVPRHALQQTLDGTGDAPALTQLGHEDFLEGHWQASVLMGEFDGATSLSVGLGYRFTDNLIAEGMFTQSSGNFANNQMTEFNLQHHLYPRWRFSPYMMLGTGKVRIEPRATLARPANRDENMAFAGAGIKWYLARGFVLRSEYRSYVLFTEEDDNRDLEEWKVGFAVMF